jgi:hypothetical protein
MRMSHGLYDSPFVELCGVMLESITVSHARKCLRLDWRAGTAFCDGICTEVMGHSLVMSNMFSLAFGLVPPADIPSVWGTVASWGLEQMGDYGAFWYVVMLFFSY